MPRSCVAVGCTNHQLMGKKGLTFHMFPDREKKSEKFKKWVQAMKRVNADGSAWAPGGKYVYICSEHFIEGKPSPDPAHPDFVPSIFKHKPLDPSKAQRKLSRFESAKTRSAVKEIVRAPKRPKVSEELDNINETSVGSVPLFETVENSCDETVDLEKSVPEELSLEVKMLRREKNALITKISCLEGQLLLTNYDPVVMKDNDDAAKYLTGLSYQVFNAVSNLLLPHMVQPRKNLPLKNQILMVVVRLRLNMPFEYLSLQTNLSQSTLNTTFWRIISLMYWKMKFLVCWPDRDFIRQTLPPIFRQYFPRLTSIIDCFEIFIERPGNLKARAQVYSNYKKHSTIKFLISCSPLGAVTFLSKAWGGRATDVQIVRESGFINPNLHEPGDQILADRGFTLQDDFATVCRAELIIPAFTKGKKQLSANEVETTRKIANVRIHVERVIGLIKKRFAILQGTLPITFIKSLNNEVSEEIPNIDKLVVVCAALVNLTTGIVYSEH